jgi:hypothetical protein
MPLNSQVRNVSTITSIYQVQTFHVAFILFMQPAAFQTVLCGAILLFLYNQLAASGEEVMVVHYEEMHCKKCVCCSVKYAWAFLIS